MTLNGGRLELLNKIRSGVRTLAFFSVLFFAAPAAAIEITAIDFNGDLIGKVIPDGKVVSLDNQLIGNVTADSLIVNFDGELIGGVIPHCHRQRQQASGQGFQRRFGAAGFRKDCR